jgi:CxxC motif-containing protein (DUF1111 family)
MRLRNATRLVGVTGMVLAGILLFGRSNAQPPFAQPELGAPLPGLTEEQMQRFLAGKHVFEAQAAKRPTPPIFGFGLLDAIPDATILAHEHRSGGRAHRLEDGRVGRFGRKARVASLLEFNGQPLPPGTDPTADPDLSDGDLQLAHDFVRFLAPPPPKQPESRQEARAMRRGHGLFHKIGCATCHTPSMRTGPNPIEALDRKVVHLYSDLLLHDMGPDLADIGLGDARPSEFRTAPLMGLRFLSRFLHDGRATTVDAAVQLHGGQATDAFERLSPEDREALLTFLGSL